jgi:hypothetical protein
VSEATLRVCIGELRKVLGETAHAPRYIATVHRRGYRFVAPVTPVSPTRVDAVPPEAEIRGSPAARWPGGALASRAGRLDASTSRRAPGVLCHRRGGHGKDDRG